MIKQSTLFTLCIFILASCSSNNAADQNRVTEEKENANLMLGKWTMDSSVFINNGIRETVSAPILPTTWTFSENGDYSVENSIKMGGTFTNTTDSLFVVLMGVPNEYEILLLNADKLQLRSTISDTPELSMKTDAFLTRIPN